MTLTPFTSPLDSLVPSEIDHLDISLAALASRYSELNGCLTKGAFFIALLAHLIYLKSSKLLPQQKEEVVDEELLPGIFQHVEEYDTFQQMAKEFAAKEREQALHFTKGPIPLPELPPHKPELVVLDIDEFSRLFGSLWQQAQERITQIFEEEWKVADMLTFIRHQLKETALYFDSLFRLEYSKDRLIATFLAVLELLKNQEAEFVLDKINNRWHFQKKHDPD